MRIRPAAAAVVAGLLLAGCFSSAGGRSTTTTTVVSLLRSGEQGPSSAVPWSRVGPGWLLAIWNRNKPVAPGERPPKGNVARPTEYLFLVDPQGGRYLITTGIASIEDWSGNGRRALVSNGTYLAQLNLSTGAISDTFVPPHHNQLVFDSAGYSRPDGLAVLVQENNNDTYSVKRYSLSGTLQLTYPASFSKVGAYDGRALESPDGTQLVLSARGGFAIVANDGTVLNQITVAHGDSCQPTRWWSTNVFVASCTTTGDYRPRLFEVPDNGGTAVPLTVEPRSELDQGDLNAWKVGTRTYVQDAGPCGYEYLARVLPDHLTTPVAVPHVQQGQSVYVLGTLGARLALQTTVAGCGGGESVLWFNPATSAERIVVGPGLNGGQVIDAILYPDPDS